MLEPVQELTTLANAVRTLREKTDALEREFKELCESTNLRVSAILLSDLPERERKPSKMLEALLALDKDKKSLRSAAIDAFVTVIASAALVGMGLEGAVGNLDGALGVYLKFKGKEALAREEMERQAQAAANTDPGRGGGELS